MELPKQASFYEMIVGLEQAGVSFVQVILVESLGSTPQDQAAKMIVSRKGLEAGTVGGGRVEAKAIALAQAILADPRPQPQFVSWTLKGDVGMTCGGAVKLYFEPHLSTSSWQIALFGAGHVAQALVPVLAPLPCSITCVDSRPEWLEKLPRLRNLAVITSASPEELVPTLPEHTFLLLMTQGHSSDRPVLMRALKERNFPYIGVIGSASKAAILRKEMIELGLDPKRAEQFYCPIGLKFGTNHPHEIALSIAAQLLAERDKLQAG